MRRIGHEAVAGHRDRGDASRDVDGPAEPGALALQQPLAQIGARPLGPQLDRQQPLGREQRQRAAAAGPAGQRPLD
jgi:hypothetical protein